MKFSFNDNRNGWIYVVTGLCLVLGMVTAASLKTQQSIRMNRDIPTTRVPGLVQALMDEKSINKSLRERVTELLGKVSEYEQVLAQGSTKSGLLAEELQKAKFIAGLSPAEGPGVEVSLQDYPKGSPKDIDLSIQQEYIIHDLDLRNFVNELVANGAEAIAIRDSDNNQRVIGITSIRCVGGVIQVNGVPMSPPFTVVAVGPPDTLANSLMMPNGLVDQFRIIEGLNKRMVQVKRKDRVVVPAYSNRISFRYAKESIPEGKTR